MRILHVMRTLDPAYGGPVEGVRNISTQAVRRGHPTEIVCIDTPKSSWLSSWKIPTHAVGPNLFESGPGTLLDRGFSGYLSKFGFTNELDRWLQSNLQRFDAVVVNGTWMYFSYAVWKATRKANVPYFLFTHGALDPWFEKRYPTKHFKKNVYWKLFEHKVFRDAERILFTTEEEKILAEHSFEPWKCSGEVVGYGVSSPALRNNFDKRAVIEKLTDAYPELRNREFILLLSRIHEKKGIDLLLKAFAAVNDRYKENALLIVGGDDGTSLLDNLKRLAKSLNIEHSVVWAGPLYGDDKWDAIRAAEVYILPSHQENFGISVTEALACGTSVLISDKVNIWREIESEDAGMVAPDTVDGAKQLLERWSRLSVTQKHQMRTNAKICFSNHFDISTSCDKLFDVLARSYRRPDPQ